MICRSCTKLNDRICSRAHLRLSKRVVGLQITHPFTKRRRDFGRQTRFTHENAQVSPGESGYAAGPAIPSRYLIYIVCMQMVADIRPNEDRARAFVVSNPKSTGVQTGPLMSEHEVSISID